MKRFWILLLSAALLAGCAAPGDNTPTTPQSAGPAAPAVTEEEMFTRRDRDDSYENAQQITLDGSGDRTITGEGVYLLQGKWTGSVIVQAGENEKVQLVLAGVEIENTAGAPIRIEGGDKVFITLAAGTENILRAGDAADAGLYSRSDLTINGSGKLTVTGGVHGISCKDDLVITGGDLEITTAGHGLDANDSVRIGGGNLNIKAGKDGIHAENTEDAQKGFVYISGGTMKLEAEGDGISAGAWLHYGAATVELLAGGGYKNGTQQSSGDYGQMPGGPGGRPPRQQQEQTTADGESMKGLKAAGAVRITGGTLNLDTADDAIHSDTDVTVEGGVFTISSGDDALHAEGTVDIVTCQMTINEAYEGLEGEKIHVRGGTIWMRCNDDGINAAGGTDGSGTEGGRDGMFGGGHRPGGPGGMGGPGGVNENALVAISGGSLTIYSGGDAIDSNGNMTVSGGSVYATNHRGGDVSILDSENRPVITGGTYIGLGMSTMMAESFSETSSQGVIACTCGNQAAGVTLTVTDSKGNTVLQQVCEYNTAIIIISTPQIEKGQSYTVTIGQTTGTVTAN